MPHLAGSIGGHPPGGQDRDGRRFNEGRAGPSEVGTRGRGTGPHGDELDAFLFSELSQQRSNLRIGQRLAAASGHQDHSPRRVVPRFSREIDRKRTRKDPRFETAVQPAHQRPRGGGASPWHQPPDPGGRRFRHDPVAGGGGRSVPRRPRLERRAESTSRRSADPIGAHVICERESPGRHVVEYGVLEFRHLLHHRIEQSALGLRERRYPCLARREPRPAHLHGGRVRERPDPVGIEKPDQGIGTRARSLPVDEPGRVGLPARPAFHLAVELPLVPEEIRS